MTMLISFQYSKTEKPEGYSKVSAQRILSSFEPEGTETMAMDQKPIIIAIMNESFSDISVLGDFESDPYLSNWYAEDSYVMRGYVYSSVYGGGTCNSEFEFLTGNSMANCAASTYSGYEDVVMYLTLMRESDREFASLLTDLEQREEPIIVCLFGDHQPSLNEEFLNTVTVQDGENEVAQDQKLQMTPYMIWANYDTGIEQTEQVGGVNEYND